MVKVRRFIDNAFRESSFRSFKSSNAPRSSAAFPISNGRCHGTKIPGAMSSAPPWRQSFPAHGVFHLNDKDVREKGGRDPNQRPDNASHPKDNLKGVAISLMSAKRHTRQADVRTVIINNVHEQYSCCPITRLSHVQKLNAWRFQEHQRHLRRIPKSRSRQYSACSCG